MKDNIKFLIGPHSLTSERVESLIRDITSRYENIEIKRYYGAELNPEVLKDEILENSLFCEKRIIVVSQIEHIDKKTWTEFIMPFLDRASDNLFLIFEGVSSKIKPEDFDVETFEDVDNLFKKIYRKSWQKKLTARDLYEISCFLKTNPYDFSAIISMLARHFENLACQKVLSEQQLIKKLEMLAEIDFKLKSGKISSEPGWEILLLDLLDISG